MEIPVGLIRPQGPSLENVELRATLEKAVDDANLNVSERLALNKKFFPNGGGFPLLKKNAESAEITEFYKKGRELASDTFSKDISELKIHGEVPVVKLSVTKSSKSNFQTNLSNALKKLKKVLNGSM